MLIIAHFCLLLKSELFLCCTCVPVILHILIQVNQESILSVVVYSKFSKASLALIRAIRPSHNV